jgi:hypothetical protein
MKNFTKILSIFVVVLFVFSACEKVSPPYKESNNTEDNGKRVLLEEYTGHTCVNCPTATLVAHELKELYGENLILMAVHAGSFADPHPGLFENDYRTEAGNDWLTYFGIDQFPSGMINRIPNAPGDYLVVRDKWGTKIAEELAKDPVAEIKINNSFAGKTGTIEVNVKFLIELEGEHKLFVGITEDSIVSAQKNNNPEIGDDIIKDYVFMHMFRGAVNGTWGEDIFNEAVQADKEYTKTYHYTLTGVPENSHVVAYVYDTDSKSILQVEEEDVK